MQNCFLGSKPTESDTQKRKVWNGEWQKEKKKEN